MTEQESSTDVVRSPLYDWVDTETRHIDIVASWENLCSTYDALRFSDPLADEERLGEFKWIVHHMNVFLTKMRRKLLSCRNADAMMEALENSFTPVGKMELNERKSLAYQKLRQQWIMAAMMKLMSLEDSEENEEE